MVLYHVTRDFSHNGKFTPRVPKERMIDEDDETKRVCVSKTIAGCLTAIPKGESQDIISELKVFRIDTERLNIESAFIMDSETLYEGYVDDALMTDEHWILKEFKVEGKDTFIIDIKRYHRDNSFPVINYMELEELESFFKSKKPEVYRELLGDRLDLMCYLYDKGVYEDYYGISCPYIYPVSDLKYSIRGDVKDED